MFPIKSKKALLLLIVCMTFLQSSCGFIKKQFRDLDAMVTIPYYRDSKDDIVSFKLPEGYIDRWVVGGNRFTTLQHDIFLHASGVDLKPETKDNQVDFKFPASLMQEIRFQLTHYGIDDLKAAQGAENLFRDFSNTKNRQCEFKKQQEAIYGLQVKLVDITSACKPEVASRDIYFKEDEQKHLTTLIQCSVKEIQESGVEGKLRPVCTHYFFFKELNSIVQMGYSRAYLPQWQELEANVKSLLISSLQISKSSN